MAFVPDDPSDQRLVSLTHPPDWTNPTPEGRYNLLVIGGGPAGLVAALGAAGLGANVALVERGLLGGDCLVHGCVPSKALLRSAHVASAARHSGALGVHAEVSTDFAAIMARMRQIRANIAPHDSAERLTRDGVDVYLGEARFTGRDQIVVDGTPLTFAKAVVATGARAALPPIPGLKEAAPLTNETLFSLTERPERLVILGAGVIGCEMAQAFASFGSEVHLIDVAERVLPREDPDASREVQRALERDGVVLHLGVGASQVDRDGDVRTVELENGDRIAGDALLVALGRRPNVDLDLDRARVAYSERGIEVDDTLRTANPRVFAAGDVIGQAQFTHAADHMARIVIRNALFHGRAKVSDLVIPRVTYTSPEVAAVGIGPSEAASRANVTEFTVPFDETDRGRTDGDEGAFCRVYADGKGELLGATIVGPGAGELLAPVTLAMTQGITLAQIASTIHPYPTRSEVLFKVASEWNRGRLKGWMKGLTTRWFGFVR